MIAAEAVARTALATDLATAEASYEKGYRHRVESGFAAGVLHYLNTVCAAYVQQASVAVQHRAMAYADIDSSLEEFLKFLQHHVYYGPHHSKIKTVDGCRDFTPFRVNTENKVLTADWHTAYLTSLPGLLAVLDEARDLPKAGNRQVAIKAHRRRTFVNPKLGALGLTIPRWADLAGVDRSAVYDYMNGQSDPRPATLRDLAEALGVAAESMP